jgi:hypothetical protein
MPRSHRLKLIALVSAPLVLVPRAPALISLDDGRQKIFVNIGATVTEDSNVFMNKEDRHDLVYGTSVSAEYIRRSGWIGVNSGIAVDSSRFSRLREQDFDNPSFRLELVKQGGRTTGSINLSASRESRADAEVNTRSTYWNIPLGFNVRYPLAGAYTLSSAVNYSERNYLDEEAFASLRTYSVSLDALRITSSVREIFAGYRYRFSETTRNSSSIDHALSIGLNGKLIRGLNGSLRAGIQTRGSTGRLPGNDRFTSWFASGSTSYEVSRKLRLSGNISKDFSTTATDDVVDSFNVSLSARYAATAKLGVGLNSGYGESTYVGQAAANLPTGAPASSRLDRFISADLSLSYSFNEHLQSSATYSHFWNTSSFELADFVRSTWSVNVSSRW